MNRLSLIILATTLCLSACSKNEEPAKPAAANATAAQPAPNTGKVIQLLEGGGYNYAEVDTGNGKRIWIAGGPIKIKVGETLEWGEHMVMHNFASRTLNRTFEEILFVNAWGPVGSVTVAMAPHKVAPGQLQGQGQAQRPQQNMAGAPGADSGSVKSVTNAGGYSYLEIVQGSKTVWLAVTETQVKAGDKVTWSNGMVMRNFNAKSLGRTFDEIIFAGGVAVVQ